MKENQIKAACNYAGKTMTSVAGEVGLSLQNFSQRVKRGTLDDEELKKVAEACGAEYKCYFEFPDGTKI